jgi:DegV family protein with EDD domain
VRIITNPGSNLSSEALLRWEIELLPQQVVVDGVEHDTRLGIPLETIDRWVASAKAHPHIIGTSAAEFATLARKLASKDRELIAVMTSRKLIASHDAAVVGARSLCEARGYEDLRIRVCDSGVTDVGAGLATMLAAAAAAEGLPLDAVAALVDSFRENVKLVFTLQSLDYLVKGGRASTLKAFFANLFGVRPVLGFLDGEVTVLGKESSKKAQSTVVAEQLAAQFAPREAVYVAVFHGGAPSEAKLLAAELRTRLNVLSLSIRTISPSIYLHTGPGGLGAAIVGAKALSFRPAALEL